MSEISWIKKGWYFSVVHKIKWKTCELEHEQ